MEQSQTPIGLSVNIRQASGSLRSIFGIATNKPVKPVRNHFTLRMGLNQLKSGFTALREGIPLRWRHIFVGKMMMHRQSSPIKIRISPPIFLGYQKIGSTTILSHFLEGKNDEQSDLVPYCHTSQQDLTNIELRLSCTKIGDVDEEINRTRGACITNQTKGASFANRGRVSEPTRRVDFTRTTLRFVDAPVGTSTATLYAATGILQEEKNTTQHNYPQWTSRTRSVNPISILEKRPC